MCRHRFGVLNDLHNELVEEGYDDIHIIGMNGFQYIDDSNACMICDETCTSTTCDEGPRTLPWMQDLDDGVNCTGENVGLCESDDTEGDVWHLWNATLRDFVILDRNGRFITRINLTSTNPDPNGVGECTDNYQNIKDLLISISNQ